ncbi:MAG: metallophosphatase family protein [Verrucomicrobiae bacterium]|nr:metallophosphatase family protein [Verrucomicrobiae bacterium]MDW8309732.1 metallophosphoesterase family protein [Verrucomicrobiales bacterium]
MKIGVISDTHGFLDPKVAGLFAGVRHILHAGDVGPWSLLAELEAIAPVSAVLGNTDEGLDLPLERTAEVDGVRCFLRHILQPHEMNGELRARLARARPRVVVFGHTHQRFVETLGGVLFLNPGYSGKPRAGAERSVAVLHCEGSDLRVEFLPL